MPELMCIAGVPFVANFSEFQIVQSPGFVIMAWERNRDVRIIPLTERPHLPDAIKLYMGDARGRWEGNTLIVETRNMNDWGWLDKHETFHSDAMTMVERFTFAGDTMQYRATITDSKVFTRPWTMGNTFRRTRGATPDYEIMEYACAEGERAVARILKPAPRP